MPFGVSKWPNSNDPRTPIFCVRGFAWGAVPAYRYSFSTTGALPPYELLNDELTLDFSFSNPTSYIWQRVDMTTFPFQFRLIISGVEEPITGPPDYTVQWQLNASAPFTTPGFGASYALWPNAITGWPTVQILDLSDPHPLLPNPITITPRKFDYPVTP